MLAPGAQLRLGDALYAEIEGSSPMHVYILDEDEDGATFLLFPLPGLLPQNPLPPGSSHRLPGRRSGRSLNWTVTSAGGQETILVIASRSPLEALERELASLPQAGSDEPSPYPRLTSQAMESLRGIGGLVPKPRDAATGRVSDALASIAQRSGAARDLWLYQIQFRNPAP
jgi:hypothetical protein